MQKIRSVKKIFQGEKVIEGAGVRLTRMFGSNEVPYFDPFLLLDHFESAKPSDYLKGFPWHPHRGIETITYVINGRIEHGDSSGNRGTIGEGDIQWMTAGSGIIHQEMPGGDEKNILHGFQLWANLPAKNKMIHPRYRNVTSLQIPVQREANRSTCRIIAGQFDSVSGPVNDIAIAPVFFDVYLLPETEFVYPTPLGHTFFAAIFRGNACFGTVNDSVKEENGLKSQKGICYIGDNSVVLFDSGSHISVSTGNDRARFLLIGGKPLNEPVAWYGPIVMNTDKELKVAFEEFQVGTFLKHQQQDVAL
jgi:redox-sensitive bicupin YhaK (pirin superfamily)